MVNSNIIVMAVVLVTWFGISILLVNIERRLKRLEASIDELRSPLHED